MFENRLKELLGEYPLPSGWAAPEIFREKMSLGAETQLDLVGLTTAFADGTPIYASAAEIGQGDVSRAYFELLERACLISALRSAQTRFELVDREGVRLGSISREQVFPESSDPSLWVYAKSNAVAAHRTLKAACNSAEAELIERDSVLAAWFGWSALQTHHWPKTSALDCLKSSHDLRLVEFKDRLGGPQWCTVGIFGFPKTDSVRRFLGFGTAETIEQAFHKAEREALQNFGFLADSAPVELPVSVRPSPEYHQELFLTSDGVRLLQQWIETPITESTQRAFSAEGSLQFARLTPTSLSSVEVVKAIDPRRLPLCFGACPLYPQGHPHHPIA